MINPSPAISPENRRPAMCGVDILVPLKKIVPSERLRDSTNSPGPE
jgi:hypothetical protein